MKLSNLRSELGAKLSTSLSPKELEELKSLQPSISSLKEAVKDGSDEHARLALKVSGLETQLSIRQSELEASQALLSDVQQEIINLETTFDELSEKLRQLNKQRDTVGSSEARRDVAGK
eukprot:gene31777-6974_t